MKRLPLMLGGMAALALLGAAAWVPLTHRAWMERDERNPVQRLVLESRSLLGIRRPAWHARVEGVEAWGSSAEGFFLSPQKAVSLTLRAWPGFAWSVSLEPVHAEPQGAIRDHGSREAWRTWFVALLEAQLGAPSPVWEPAQRDCAGLLRFAFREAWGPHTEAWRDRVGFDGPPVAGEPDLLHAGPWRRAFPTPDGWQPFAKGAFLRTHACIALSRECADGRPGDLLFFSRGGAQDHPDHAMAFVRPAGDGQPMLIYHTGPERSGQGEVRRVRLDDLLHHPDPAFRPLPENPSFLGVYRWRVLHQDGQTPVARVDAPVATSILDPFSNPHRFPSC